MRKRSTTAVQPIERGLILAFSLAVLITAVSIASAAFAGSGWQAVAGLVLLAIAVALFIARYRGTQKMVSSLGLAVTVLLIGILPDLTSTIIFLLLVTQVIIAFDVGLAVAAGIIFIYAVVFTSTALSTPGFPSEVPVLNVVRENALTALLLLLAAGVGALIRTVERSRSEAATVGVELEVANAALRTSLLLERDLVLAEERARSARQLHDGLGHRLTLVAMSLEYAQQAHVRDPEKAWAEVGTASATTREALSEMRLWVRALDPPVADEGVAGAAAFDAIADAFRGTGLDVRVTYRGEGPALGRDAALFATRFIQEGLTNVLRHAVASRVDIEVIQSPQQVRFTIGDDGSGPSSPTEGFGRRSLRERAETLGGTVSSRRSALGGFELSAVLPLTGRS